MGSLRGQSYRVAFVLLSEGGNRRAEARDFDNGEPVCQNVIESTARHARIVIPSAS